MAENNLLPPIIITKIGANMQLDGVPTFDLIVKPSHPTVFFSPISSNKKRPLSPPESPEYIPSKEELEYNKLEELLDSQQVNFFTSAKARARTDKKPKYLPHTPYPSPEILNQQDYLTVFSLSVAGKAYCAKTKIIDSVKDEPTKKKLTFSDDDKENQPLQNKSSQKKHKKTKSKIGLRNESPANITFVQKLCRNLFLEQSTNTSIPKKSSELVTAYLKAKQKNYISKIIYEICHIFGNSSGGPPIKAKHGSKNFVLASYDANTMMATIETAILQKPGIAVEITVYLQPGTRIAVGIQYRLISTLPEYPRILEIEIPGNLSWYTTAEEAKLSKKVKKFVADIQQNIKKLSLKSNLTLQKIELPYVINPEIIATKLTPCSENKKWQLGPFRPAPLTIEQSTPLSKLNTRSPKAQLGLESERETSLKRYMLSQTIFELFQQVHHSLLEIYNPENEMEAKNTEIALLNALSQLTKELQSPSAVYLFLPDLQTLTQDLATPEDLQLKNLKSPLQTCLLLIALVEEILENETGQIFKDCGEALTKIAVQLIAAGAFLHITDSNNNHILHHAATLNAENVWQACMKIVINLPSAQRLVLLSKPNCEGYTTLDCAKASNFETRALALISLGATSGSQLQLQKIDNNTNDQNILLNDDQSSIEFLNDFQIFTPIMNPNNELNKLKLSTL